MCSIELCEVGLKDLTASDNLEMWSRLMEQMTPYVDNCNEGK